ncbi:MAG: deaminase [Candidatus Pacebacteria bacterium]|nr:deaminase [Candidatus Paceibacterota bacterium]
MDPDFRGQIGVLLRNRGDQVFVVEKGMRIAQLIFSQVEIPNFEIVDQLSGTKRGEGGFGSTGLKGKGLGTDDYDAHQRELDEYYMTIVLATAERSRCVRGVKKIDGHYQRDDRGKLVGQTRKFGCIIVKGDNIIAIGFNDQYPGSLKCEDVGCLREESGIASGTQLEKCRAMHAEWWAITNLTKNVGGASAEGATMYVNAEPCEICAKIIAGLKIDTLVLLEGVYPTNGLNILKEAGVNVRYVKL